MPFKRSQYIDEISYKLSQLRLELTDHNKLGLYNDNLMAENFFCGFLNILKGWNLKNANDVKKNFPGIDLIDEDNQIAVQVSSTATAEKIQHSLDELLAHSDDSEEYQFYMLVITEKQKRYQKEFDRGDRISFDKETDIWDVSDLLSQINKRETTMQTLEKLYQYLEDELGFIDKEHLKKNRSGNRINLSSEELEKEAYVFVSYAHKDRTQVYPILYALREAGLRFWYDDNLEHGADYAAKLQDALDSCAGVLVFLSPNVNDSKWCQKEINYALNHKEGKVYPVHLQLTQLKNGLGLQMEDIHSVLLYEGGNASEIESNLRRQIPEVFELETGTVITENLDLKKKKTSREDISAKVLEGMRRIHELEYGSNEKNLVLHVGDTFEFGSYPQDADGGIKPIVWRVLDVDQENSRALLLSDKILDAAPYNEEDEDTNWAECSLRKRLNSSDYISGEGKQSFLYEAFTEKERNKICDTLVTSDRNPHSEYKETDQGKMVIDELFLLSGAEIVKYFAMEGAHEYGWGYRLGGDKGSTDTTDYAKWTVYGKKDIGNIWWLRSVGISPRYAMFVSDDGNVGAHGIPVYYERVGVRPALWITFYS